MKTCYLMFILFFVVTFLNLKFIDCSNRMNPYVAPDTPKTSDLTHYLYIIDRISKFYVKNINEVDINVYFGLLLNNVNLKRAVKNDKIWLVKSFHRQLMVDIIQTNEKLMDFFLENVESTNKRENRIDKMVLSLFKNQTQWLYSIEHFNASMELIKYKMYKMSFKLSDWNRYVKKVYNIDNGIPDPKNSDRCLASLSSNPTTYGYKRSICNVDDYCRKMLKHGTDYGYALTHRLLFLLLARYGRNCVILSSHEDKFYTEKFCSMNYFEAEHIANHNYGLVDLMLESMCLCALNGNTQFLRRSWLEKISNFQTSAGCFGQMIDNYHAPKTNKVNRTWMMNRGEDQDTLSGYCNGHVSALAAATYAFAVRFLLEVVF